MSDNLSYLNFKNPSTNKDISRLSKTDKRTQSNGRIATHIIVKQVDLNIKL